MNNHAFVAKLDNVGTMCDLCYGARDHWLHGEHQSCSYTRPTSKCPYCGYHMFVNKETRKIALHARVKNNPSDRCPAIGLTIFEAIQVKVQHEI